MRLALPLFRLRGRRKQKESEEVLIQDNDLTLPQRNAFRFLKTWLRQRGESCKQPVVAQSALNDEGHSCHIFKLEVWRDGSKNHSRHRTYELRPKRDGFEIALAK